MTPGSRGTECGQQVGQQPASPQAGQGRKAGSDPVRPRATTARFGDLGQAWFGAAHGGSGCDLSLLQCRREAWAEML